MLVPRKTKDSASICAADVLNARSFHDLVYSRKQTVQNGKCLRLSVGALSYLQQKLAGKMDQVSARPKKGLRLNLFSERRQNGAIPLPTSWCEQVAEEF